MKERIVILGAGESGTGAAILALKKGCEVFVSDAGKIREKYRKTMEEYGVEWEEGAHTIERVLAATLVIKSPGISEKAPVMQAVRAQGIPVVSEIEFAARHTRALKICITGSNGKTTTTLLIHHMLKKAGINAGLAGNVGSSFARQVAEEEHAVYVIELSSFQLDDMYDFRAEVAVLMNITPDHLDRYNYRMQNYVDAKFRITRNQTPDDWFIYFADDEVISRELARRQLAATCIPFSLGPRHGDGAGILNDHIDIHIHKNRFSMSILDLALQGKHNACNSMAAAISGMVVGIRNERIRESLTDFQGVEHRLERFLKVHGIEFINDSKATNVNSTWYALESMTHPVVWIAGGVDKGNDYTMLCDLVREKVKAIVCLGVDNAKIHKAFDGMVKNIVDASSMAEAVKSAYYLARNGDTVLLSPACASFDLFENYEDRGHQFKQEVRNL
ncbi:MAG: UDP-N-acetylmuramoyl-L-alanine--D-glutamate ligase [Prolixibacteraceae bacterium]|jgi:UDP-N-acetylmuramoylalanine--D-glutamate ligase|nr:UDP-N-acetylmuramoyl-L-alanine--D-glutamate ligase [Prolixibacteraceae bacterium]HNQ38501.1 UDP-N-acetylmuramoyl-L-alanine--D-glutamate ligase [Prolixibacteraceae bacterium]